MIVRVLVIGLLALVLTGSLVELSCLAGEARVRTPGPSLFTEAPEPELPIASEFGDLDAVPGAALTR
ncbi:MAG: hypothetical protein A3E31_08180 [Candidatus Rokubacteria bacterium RIFCSPHIGHO2_12_FULL_73_22]|nr:MAG: hypothetical protein A3E31_08180 [Candidatus Rokubacteria bacterium RIFCSPHIGHO2_12_FULL_73_22]OGL00796.1 MAG: hypothetical protein A3D33_12925 [Candidatus Rokubacteria bacterium RIFCSPHIGHO2_02_FULL_73_26]OGL27925.1 MAG: hypothetical protein A3G44_06905 [Candidatus Rokubacteria bacterium RIFCSPLOWO2_12_FULL_73_47]HLE79643.1 hypothetical protein [Candidatus Limnocylindrales bacterium]